MPTTLSLPPVPVYLRFPSERQLTPDPAKFSVASFKTQKLLVGVSVTESFAAPDATEKLLGVKLFPLPDESFPKVVAVVAELIHNFLHIF